MRDLELPKDAALVAIVRGDRVITPTPEEPLEAGDELLFVALPEAEPAIRAPSSAEASGLEPAPVALGAVGELAGGRRQLARARRRPRSRTPTAAM